MVTLSNSKFIFYGTKTPVYEIYRDTFPENFLSINVEDMNVLHPILNPYTLPEYWFRR